MRNIWRKLVIAGLCAAVIPLGGVLNVSAAPEVIQSMDYESSSGHIPSVTPQFFYDLKGNKSLIPKSRTALPKRFSSVDIGLSTVVKNQSPWGSCWSFGAMSSLEGNVLTKSGSKAKSEQNTPDYSERHLAWFAYQLQSEEGRIAEHAGSSLMDLGGNRELATGLMSSWTGAASETDVPYLENTSDDWSVAEGLRSNSEVRLQNADFLPGTAIFSERDENLKPTGGYSLDSNALKILKQTIINNGVIDVSYYADQSKPGEAGDGTYITKDNKSHYTYKFEYPNHEVSIVGWDDDYKKENFIEGHQPEGDGAWIVKNSWGSDWGDNGYFYLSYYDQSICDFTSFQAELPNADGEFKYDNNYQYDLLGLRSSLKFAPVAESASIANIFTVEGESELLEAVSVVTADPDSKVDIAIYKVTDNSSPVNGTPVYSKQHTISFGGYHTIELSDNEKIPLLKGEKFSVVQTIKGMSGYYHPIEMGTDDFSSGSQSVVSIAAGQSFYKFADDDWYDNTNTTEGGLYDTPLLGNAMIKAFTTNVSSDAAPSLTNITFDCYDASGKKIGESVSHNVTSTEISITDLPSYTASLKIGETKFAADAPGEIQKIQVHGLDYPQDMMMIRSDLEGEKTVAITVASTSAEPLTADYTLSFSFPSTKLDGQNNNFLIDANGLIPQSLTFTTAQKSDGAAYNAVKNSLSALGGSDQFKLFDVAAKKEDGTAFELKPQKTVELQCSTKDGYKNAKIFYVELSLETALLTDVTDTESSTADFLSGNISQLNGMYVLSVVKDAPEIPVMESFTYSPSQTLADIMFPEVSGGTWAWDAPETVPSVTQENYPATFTATADSEFTSYKTMIKLTITKAVPVILTVSGSNLTYGQTLADSSITGTTVDRGGDVTLTGSYSWKDKSVYPIVRNVGYDVVFHPSDPNYTEATGNASIIVTAKQIKAHVNPASKVYGDTNPAFTFTSEDGALVANDTKEMLNVSLSCTADTASVVGKYEVSGSSDAENYEVTLTSADLTVNKRPITLIPDDVAITYGDVIPDTFIYSAEGLVNGDTPDMLHVTLSSNADTSSPAGQYSINGEASADNYSISVKNGTLTINPVVMSQTNFGIINNSSLSNDLLNNLSISGSFKATEKSRIIITDIANTSEEYLAFAKQAPSQKQLLLANISLEGVTGINGPIQVNIPVDPAYNGSSAAVLHYVTKDKLDENNTKVSADMVDAYNGLTVQNGIVSVKAYSLSPFAVVLASKTTTPDNTNTANTNNTAKPSGVVMTGDESSLAGPIIGMLLAILAIAAVVVLVLKKRRL